MPVVIRTVVTGLDEAELKLSEIMFRLASDKGNAVLRATNKVAGVWEQNFNSEGSMVGGWAQLAEQTQNMREWAGYPPERPILVRYEALRAVVVDMFKDAKGSTNQSLSDNYSDQITSGRLFVGNGIAMLDAHGWKIANQYDTQGDRFGHPARPYWFVDDNVIAAAREGVTDWLVEDVID